MKIILLLSIFLSSILFSEVIKENNSSVSENKSISDESKKEVDSLEPAIIKDTSGLSDEEIRKKANEKDKEEKKVKKKDVIKTIMESKSKEDVDISKLESTWEELSPTPKKYDWIQTKSGEWFKGYIKALYKDSLEFDSDEVGLYTFDFDDVKQIKSYQILTVNIEDIALIKGIVRFQNNKITIIQGDTRYEFNRDQIISVVSEGDRERDVWSGKITISLDKRTGNTKSFNYSAKADIKRRTAKTSLQFDYLGRISSKNDAETANDHRINEKFDIYITRHSFWTPIFSEFYRNTYKNIQSRYRAGAGLGYIFLDTARTEWDISAGPAYMYTQYVSVQKNQDNSSSSLALEISTNLEMELNSRMDLEYAYLLTLSNKSTGTYSHHMVLTLENEITSWLDFDISGIWDYTLRPKEKADGTIPLQDDFQILVGLGIEF